MKQAGVGINMLRREIYEASVLGGDFTASNPEY